ncbi:MAG TPA: saccharopine dehydrogenase NADP-binding domain-containing protein, partial [Kofleriaceae bacterium]|nr:saccharopine dehydrogenase NADP-binding domain-containing protein [Kofleriaceae bacterium]
MIVVYGATGMTGTLIAEALVARGMGVTIAGRDRGRLDALAARLEPTPAVRVANVHEPAALADAFAGARAVVSCAGPFLQVGEPVLRAALDAGAHYLDTTGEQAFMREMLERYDSRAHKAGLAAVPGFAFEVALGDWAASEAARRVRAESGAEPADEVDEVAIGYAVRGFAPTAGTLESAISAMARPCSVWREDRWEPVAPGSRARSFRFAGAFGDQEALLFPSGEVVTV